MNQGSGTKSVIPRDDTGPHAVETPTSGTLLLAGVREAGGLHQIKCGQEGLANPLFMILPTDLLLINCKVVVHSSWITIYDLRLSWRSPIKISITREARRFLRLYSTSSKRNRQLEVCLRTSYLPYLRQLAQPTPFRQARFVSIRELRWALM